MRVIWLCAVLAGLLGTLTGQPPVIAPGPAEAAPGGFQSRAQAVLAAHPEIWAGAEVVRGERSLVIGLPGAFPALAGAVAAPAGTAARAGAVAAARSRLAGIARAADRASRAVARLAGTVRPLILVPATTEQAAVLAAPAALGGLAAVAGPDRVIVEPRSFDRLTVAGRDVVLAHELAHVALGAATDGRTPKWLVEGLADYIGYLDAGIPVRTAAAELAADVRAGRAPRSLPDRADFATGAPRLAQAYQEAWLACRYVAARFGERALVTLYRESMRSDPRTALRRTLGLTPAEFTAAWRSHVRAELRP
ncbi:hypothetical protein [Sphaerisporangium sp. TRM90804]|uniref:hypothetical protein n=1 Tax=Sphaerisporangium sp. TRM90804 TaxID=3031113 RepID=UPI00244D0941|nr:hypothetical protein [Sphaerisporangium sp. TRM90804]MDH2424555.1 hypothetical protein [Sphaerisporangium sp. TRM90804]